ncbi:IPT/TIG domain-containing protein [bacterium]|nr:IPT/TIG domain-containing protein [bacterium]
MTFFAIFTFWVCSKGDDPPDTGDGPTEEQLQQLEGIQQSQLEYYTEFEYFLKETDTRIFDLLEDGLASIGTYHNSTYYTMEGGFYAAVNNFADKKPFISLGFCYSALGDWPAYLVNSGASAAIAYRWAIGAWEDADWMLDFFEKMCDTTRATPLTIGEWDISEDRLYYNTADAHWVALLYSGADSMTLWEPFRITSINPTSGSEDTIVTIRGIGFGDIENEVRFDDVVATGFFVWSDTLIRVAVPAGFAEGAVVIVKVVVEGKESNGVEFTIESDIDLSGYDRVHIQIQYISSTWLHSDGDTTGSPSRGIDTGSLYGSFSGFTFHHYLDSIPGIGQELITEATVTLNSSANRVISFEYTITGTNTDGYRNFFTITGTDIPVLGAGYNFFRLEGMGVCSNISNLEERTDYPGGIWIELIDYGCNEDSGLYPDSRIQIVF